MKTIVKNMIKQDYKLTIWDNGFQFFDYQNRMHRLDGPASIYFGLEYYCVDGYFISAAHFCQLPRPKGRGLWGDSQGQLVDQTTC